MTGKKLTRSQAARVAALALAHQMTPEQRSQRARKGGNATLDKHGTVHFVRMGLMRRGWEPATPGQRAREHSQKGGAA